ncbi:hypothetical protein ACFX11_002912 [Malus domestica]
MSTLEIEQPYPKPTHSLEPDTENDDVSPIEQVRLTVTNTDDPTLPVWTFRMWFLGLVSCSHFSTNSSPTEPSPSSSPRSLSKYQHSLLVISWPKSSQQKRSTYPDSGPGRFSLNPGPFNIKEHVLITIFANAGSAFGAGSAYAVGIVNIIKAFYHRKISLLAGWLLIITTQVLGYGWAGLLRKYVVEPAHMWWPNTLVQVSLFRALHEKDEQRMSRAKFFLITLVCSFTWYAFPGYLFTTLTNISWVCWLVSKSVTAQQIGSGMRGLGVGSLTLDWSAVASFLFQPPHLPFPCHPYWGLDSYSAQKFPIFSSHLFTAEGQDYNITAIVNDKFQLDIPKYEEQGRIHLSMFFALTYGFGFATIPSTLTHVALFYGR